MATKINDSSGNYSRYFTNRNNRLTFQQRRNERSFLRSKFLHGLGLACVANSSLGCLVRFPIPVNRRHLMHKNGCKNMARVLTC